VPVGWVRWICLPSMGCIACTFNWDLNPRPRHPDATPAWTRHTGPTQLAARRRQRASANVLDAPNESGKGSSVCADATPPAGQLSGAAVDTADATVPGRAAPALPALQAPGYCMHPATTETGSKVGGQPSLSQNRKLDPSAPLQVRCTDGRCHEAKPLGPYERVTCARLHSESIVYTTPAEVGPGFRVQPLDAGVSRECEQTVARGAGGQARD
jgi:hypothetical protein